MPYCRSCGAEVGVEWTNCPKCEAPMEAERAEEQPKDEGVRPGLLSGSLAIVAGVLVALGSFLPWITLRAPFVGQISRSGLEGGDGIFTLVLGLGLAALGVARITSDTERTIQRWALLLGAIVGGIGGLNFADAQARAADVAREAEGAAIGAVGMGLWVILVGAVFALLAGLITKPMRIA